MDNQNKVQKNTQTDMMVARQAQEVQVAMLSAKKFPRDELSAINRIKATCQRPTLAEQAVYTYPRGGQKVSGPSIRLAEALAQNWGNLDTGIIELENRNGKSEMMAYAWDLETNTRVTKTFSVDHVRDTKQGRKDLTDARDIYEATANFGARRMRACILSVIPGDVVDMAVQECRKTLADKDQRPVNEILNELLKAFNHEAMCLKTVSKLNISKNGPLSVELQKAIVSDQAVIEDEDKLNYVDGELSDVNASEDQKAAIIAANKTDEVDEDISDESIEQGLDQAIEEAKEQEQGELIGEVASNGRKNTRGKSRNQRMDAA
jgi:hypothetical protein